MKKIYSIAIIMLGAFSLGAIGNAHAYAIDGEVNPVGDKYEVTGFGKGDSLVVTANTNASIGVSPVLTDVGISVSSEFLLDTTGLVSNFIHDFVFIAIQDTFASVETASANLSGIPGNIIAGLTLEVWHILDGLGEVDANIGSAVVLDATPGQVGVELEQGETYVVRMKGDALPALNPNYTLTVVSAVPVPAAVWLFGTAMVGLFGLRRKNKNALAAA